MVADDDSDDAEAAAASTVVCDVRSFDALVVLSAVSQARASASVHSDCVRVSTDRHALAVAAHAARCSCECNEAEAEAKAEAEAEAEADEAEADDDAEARWLRRPPALASATTRNASKHASHKS